LQGVAAKDVRASHAPVAQGGVEARGEISCNTATSNFDYSHDVRFSHRRLSVADWKRIVELHGGLVWATAYRLLGNSEDASDCFQETFLEAVKVSRREAVGDWSALLRHLATVRAIDLLRVRCRHRARTDTSIGSEAAVSREANPLEDAKASELAERLRAALPHLSQDQAAVFCLSCLENLSYREIGERLGVTVNAVGVLLHRARHRLRELLISVDTEIDGEE
jgi:RNA polymerase sigma-70 factor, ECF subfamily